MRVFLQKRKVRGVTEESRLYRGAYRMPWMEEEASVSLKTRDRQIAEKRLREFVRVLELTHEGLPIPATLWGAPSHDLAAILDEYLASLHAQNRRGKHVEDTGARIHRLAEECGWRMVEDVSAATFERWRSSKPFGIRSHKPMSPKSLKEYLVSMRAFIRWMMGTGYIEDDPLATVPQVEVRGSETHARRAWTEEELRRFMGTRPSGLVDYRPAVYLLAMTGLRREELQKLCWGDVTLEGVAPSLVVRAKNAKNRRSEAVPLHPETVE